MELKFSSSLLILGYLLGFIFAVVALWRSRTPQGTTAWVMALLSMPFLAIPAFLVFGRNVLNKYRRRRRLFDRRIQEIVSLLEKTYQMETKVTASTQSLLSIAHMVNQPFFTSQNSIDLLIDGNETYERMFQEIKKAQKYILFQFYIFRDDTIGQKFKDLLVQKAQQGVKIYFLYDNLGTRLSRSFLKSFKDAGIETVAFKSTRAIDTKIQINFRNHRKVIVIDGVTSFIGGLNIGDDYLGRYPEIGSWRDTHVVISGPATISAQISFIKDWNWAHHEILNLNWTPTSQAQNAEVMILHTGPADVIEAALLTYIHLINTAQNQVWISNPYFVPSEGLVNALALAAQRGVDVRIIVPEKNDNRLVHRASQAYIEKLTFYGVKFYRYQKGFPHQKVMKIDDQFSVIGSTNFDSRSLFINFEIQAITTDRLLNDKMNQMFLNDFSCSQLVLIKEFARQSLWNQFLVKAANLVSPML